MLPYVSNAQDLTDALCWAAQGGHHDTLQAILDNSKVSLDGRLKMRRESVSVTTGGETALIHAAKALSVECVKILLAKGADPTVRAVQESFDLPNVSRRKSKSRGETVLHALAQTSIKEDTRDAAKEIISMVTSAGGDMEAENASGNTPLLCTLSGYRYSGRALMGMELFLQAGANPLAIDDDGDTLLHKACRSTSDLAVVRKLLELRVDPSTHRTSDGETPLHASMSNIHCAEGLVELLTSFGADINAKDSKDNTPMILLCRTPGIRFKETTRALLDFGADVNAQNDEGETALHLFTLRVESYKNSDELNAIIAKGANLELRDREGHTVLLKAVAKAKQDTVDILVQQPLELAARTYRCGKSALHLACLAAPTSAIKMVQSLVRHGADPGWLDNDGNTVLHEVCGRFQGSHDEVLLLETLIEMGVPLTALNARRRTPLHLQNAPREDGARYHSSNGHSRYTTTQILLTHDPSLDVNAGDIDGYTPLMLAAASESQSFSLINAGADLSAKSLSLRTALHCAATARKPGVIDMILQHAIIQGASLDINPVDEAGRTPLYYACRSGIAESVKILIDAGADVNGGSDASSKPLAACTAFLKENLLWVCLNNGSAGADEFRPVEAVPKQPYGRAASAAQEVYPRIGYIASMLLDAGAAKGDLVKMLNAAVEEKSVELVSILRRHITTKPAVSFAEAQLMYSSQNVRSLLDLGNYTSMRPEEIDESMLEALLERNVNFAKYPSVQYGESKSALTVLTAFGIVERMSKIFDCPATFIDESDVQDRTKIRPLLHVACERSVYNLDVVKLLVRKAKVNVNEHQIVSTDYDSPEKVTTGNTALHILARGDYWWQIEAIKFLVENGAEVDSLNETGQTPLDIACTKSYSSYDTKKQFFKPQCCEILLQLGADPSRINKDGLTPLNHAGSDAEMIRILLDHGADGTKGSKGVLMSAVEAGDVQTLRMYLESGADCNLADSSTAYNYDVFSNKSNLRRYPLLRATMPSSYGDAPNEIGTLIQMIGLFLEHGADVLVSVSDDDLLIHYVFEHSPTSLLKPFLDRPGINFNAKNAKGRNVLMTACKSTVGYEGQYKASFITSEEQQRLRNEYTPAYLALAESPLYANQLDYSATDSDGQHILMYLLPHWSPQIEEEFLSKPEVQRLVLQKDLAGFSPLHHALKKLKLKPCKTFIERFGADITEPDPNGDTALHHLFRVNSIPAFVPCKDMIKQYLAAGGDINQQNNDGETALHAYFSSYHYPYYEAGSEEELLALFDPVDFLVSNGANVQAVTRTGETVLHVIARRDSGDYYGRREGRSGTVVNAEYFKRMVELGCDVLQEDNEGRTALDIASGHNDAIMELYQRRK
jgi:ankyrin repeat protein